MSDSTRTHHEYWDSFYASQASSQVPEEPSAFARWVKGRLRPEQHVVELGFGTGRDALWFARQDHPVNGYDFAEHAVQRAQGHADSWGLAATFSVLDLYDSGGVEVVSKEIAEATAAPAVYGRFLIHSLEDPGRAGLLNLAAAVLSEGGHLYLEFRTGQDQGHQHLFGDDHYRVYLDPEVVEGEIEELGGIIEHLESGHGLAVYRTEDPHVARICARWSV